MTSVEARPDPVRPDPVKPGPGRPRSTSADSAIHEAALSLLAECGYEAVTIEAVAEAAGVAKSTIYRRYPGKVDLIAGALECGATTEAGADGAPLPDTGSVEGDAIAMLQKMRDRFASETKSRIIAAIALASTRDPKLAEAHAAFVARRRAWGRSLLERAIVRGELPPDTDTDLLVDLLSAPVYYRSLVSHDALDDDTIRSIVRMALSSVR